MLAATNKAICGKKKGPFQHSFAAGPAASGAGIRTGVISWFPLEGGESIETFPDGFVVDLLQEGNDHVMRHHELSSATNEEKQYKSKVSDHGMVVVELTRMLDPSDGEFSGWR